MAERWRVPSRRLLWACIHFLGVQLGFVVPTSVLRPLSNAAEETSCSERSAYDNSFALRHRSEFYLSASFFGDRKLFSSAYSVVSRCGGVVGWPAICTESHILRGLIASALCKVWKVAMRFHEYIYPHTDPLSFHSSSLQTYRITFEHIPLD